MDPIELKERDRWLLELDGEGVKPADTPGSKDTAKNMSNSLDLIEEARARVFMAGAGLSLYFVLDRPESQFATKTVMQDMAKPTELGWARLKRLVRYFKGKRRLTYKFRWQNLPKYLDLDADSDWAGETANRKSTSCGYERLGEHLINPDCVADAPSAADLFFAKQVGFALLPFVGMLLSLAFWAIFAKCKRVPFAGQWSETSDEASSPKDMCVVTVGALLYLLFPTLCNHGSRECHRHQHHQDYLQLPSGRPRWSFWSMVGGRGRASNKQGARMETPLFSVRVALTRLSPHRTFAFEWS